MSTEIFGQMYKEETLLPKRLVIEQFILLYLGIKSLTSISLPQELPTGADLAEIINKDYAVKVEEYENKFSLRKIAISPKKMAEKSIRNKQQILKKVFDDTVYPHEEYFALLAWGRALGLKGLEYEVRPSLREMVLYAQSDLKEEIERLSQFRMIIRKDSSKDFDENTPLQVLLYPEELNPRYVEEIGRLSGYPSCCVQAFLNDRKKGDNPFIRAAIQYYEAEQEKAPKSWSYFLSGFVPCRPDCHAAQDKGHQAHERLLTIDKQMALDYQQLVQENKETIAKQAEELQAQILKLQKEKGNQ